MAVSVAEVRHTLTEQHRRIKSLMEDVLTHEGPDREEAFTQFRQFLAAHEAAEEECLNLPALRELDGETEGLVQRVKEEEEATEAITALERVGATSPEFPAKFELFRQSVITHAGAEEHEEFARLTKPLDDGQMARLQKALLQVPDLASPNGDSGTSFRERLQAARAEFRAGAPTARSS